jgi:hypothetical protein
LRNCATSQKVAVSIPDGGVEVLHGYKPSGRIKSYGVDSASNTKEYQEYLLGVKAAGA